MISFINLNQEENMKKALLLICIVLLSLSCVFASGVSEGGKTVVTFWNPYGEGSWSGDYLAKVIEKFNAANPTIEVQSQPMSDYATII